MLVEPLSRRAAQALSRKIAESGWIAVTSHAEEELTADDVERDEMEMVLMRGSVTEVRLEDGTWRYRVVLHDVTVVVAFDSEDELAVVTGWRDP